MHKADSNGVASFTFFKCTVRWLFKSLYVLTYGSGEQQLERCDR
jgi:hypothetical protein